MADARCAWPKPQCDEPAVWTFGYLSYCAGHSELVSTTRAEYVADATRRARSM